MSDKPQGIAKPPSAPPLKQAVETALACRTMEAAIADGATMRLLARSHGDGPVLIQSTAMVTQAMEYFAPGRRMSAVQCNLLAETLMERYPHETLSDIALFIRRAAMGDFEDGKTYGALDIPTMLRWWRTHLDQKAEAMENAREAEDAEAHETGQALLGLKGVREAVEAMATKARDELREQRALYRMERLTKALPNLTLEQLREAWKFYDRPSERALIQAQAARMGYLGNDLKHAQERIDQHHP